MQVMYMVFLLVLALAFLVAGYLIRLDRSSNYLFIAGFLIVLVAGLYQLPGLSSPLEFYSGDIETSVVDGNTTTTTTTRTYSPISDTQSSSLSLILIITGMYGMQASIAALRNFKEEEEQ